MLELFVKLAVGLLLGANLNNNFINCNDFAKIFSQNLHKQPFGFNKSIKGLGFERKTVKDLVLLGIFLNFVKPSV